MCGIYGYSWSKLPDMARLAKLNTLLGVFNDRRGGQSWGVWTQEAGRRRGLGELGVNLPVEALVSKLMFAHSRYATHGAAENSKNAHPFKEGHIMGAHNGIIYNHEDLNYKYDRSFSVDSRHIFAHLANGLPFEEMQGYGTIEWIDKRENGRRIYLAKLTDSGQLSIRRIKSKYGEGVVWSSDGDHLEEALLGVFNTVGTHFRVDVGEKMYVEDGALFTTGEKNLAISSRKVDKRTQLGRASEVRYSNGKSYYSSNWSNSDAGFGDDYQTWLNGSGGSALGFKLDEEDGVTNAVDSKGTPVHALDLLPPVEEPDADTASYDEWMCTEEERFPVDTVDLRYLMDKDAQHYKAVREGNIPPDKRYIAILEDLWDFRGFAEDMDSRTVRATA